MWTYKGIDVYPAGQNNSGIRWIARAAGHWSNHAPATLRADSKQGMRELINRYRANR